MRHPPRALLRRNLRPNPAFDMADSGFAAEPSNQAKANARAGALHGFVLALLILLVVVPIVLITSGCASKLTAAELSIPF
jgi:hypothetical protein